MLTKLQKRAVELTYRHGLTHLSSVLNTVPVLEEIYNHKHGWGEPVVLGNCHASVALYVVLELHGMGDADKMIRDYGVHCHRDMDRGIWVSGGSLGQSETVAVGLALADRNLKVWLVTSDGALMEGASWEAMRIARQQELDNLRVHVIANGFGAYRKIETWELPDLPRNSSISFGVHLPEFLRGLDGHYLLLNEEQYQTLMK